MTQQLHSERGSLPLALLAVLVVGGLVATLVATVVTGQRHTRSDQVYEQSLQVAEVGLERGSTLVASGGWSSEAIRNAPVTIEETSTDGGTYEVTATYDEDTEAIIVSSTGRSGDKARTVVGVLQDSPLFPVGAFADKLLNFAGTNHAWSYNSETQDAGGPWGTGNGRVGSNEALVFTGTANANPDNKTTDQVILYNVENNPHNPPTVSRCTHTGGNNCVDVQLVDEAHDLPDNPLHAELEAYCEATGYDGVWRASEQGGVLPGGTHCFDELHFDQDVTLSLTPTQPEAIVFSKGRVSFIKPTGSPRVRINCGNCEQLTNFPLPYPRRLQVFTDTSETIPFGNHSRVAALLLAPHATCGQSGNSSVNFYGSLVCKNIGNVGNWKFYWDDALAQYRDDVFVFRRWYEE